MTTKSNKAGGSTYPPGKHPNSLANLRRGKRQIGQVARNGVVTSRVREKLLAKKGVTERDEPKSKKQLKREQRQKQREALRKQVLKYGGEDGYIRTPIPNVLFVECLKLQLLRREKRDTPCPRGFPEWWFVKLED